MRPKELVFTLFVFKTVSFRFIPVRPLLLCCVRTATLDETGFGRKRLERA